MLKRLFELIIFCDLFWPLGRTAWNNFKQRIFYAIIYKILKPLTTFLFIIPFGLGYPSHPLLAQDYTVRVQHFTETEGLYYREVRTIFEDRDGFIWIATGQGGLQKFDGKVFENVDITPLSGKLLNICQLWQDPQGWLWLEQTKDKEYLFYHPDTKIFLTPAQRFGDDFPVRGGLADRNSRFKIKTSKILENSKGQSCILNKAPNELVIYQPDDTFEVIALEGLPNHPFYLQHIDTDDHLWVQSINHENLLQSLLYKIDLEGHILAAINPFTHPELIDLPSKEKQKVLHSFWEEVNSKLPQIDKYFGTLNWELSKDSWKAFAPNQPHAALFSFDPNEYYKNIFPDGRTILEDSRGLLWVGSVWGLTLVNAKRNRFKNLLIFDDQQTPPFNNSVRGLAVEGDKLYANLEYSGLLQINKASPNDWSFVYAPKNDYLSHSFLLDPQGEIFTGHPNGKLRIIHKDGSYQQMHHQKKETISKKPINFIYQDTQKVMWVGRYKELSYKLPEDNFLRKIPLNAKQPQSKKIYAIAHISSGLDSQIWLCSFGALYSFDPQSKTITAQYGIQEKGIYHLPAENFYQLHIDNDSIHWLGTNNGLLRWNRSTNEKQLFTVFDGLSNNSIYTITEDEHDQLWLGSARGLMRFHKKTFQVTAYLKKDGISNEDFNRNSTTKDEDGNIYLGTMGGITAFHPDDFQQMDTVNYAKLYLQAFKIFDGTSRKLLDKTTALTKNSTITFRPKDLFFRLKFILLTYEEVDRGRYAWKIDGIDQDWNYQKENTLQIGKLPYGSHTLYIKGQDGNGLWSPHELVYKVNVLRPFYLQNWFFLLVALGGATSIFLFNYRQTQRLRARQKELESSIYQATTTIRQKNELLEKDKQTIEQQAQELRQLDKVKSRFFANVSHELRTPLTLILGPISSLLKTRTLNKKHQALAELSKKNAQNLLSLVNEILDLTKMESGKIELVETPLEVYPLLLRIKEAFVGIAEQKNIQYTFDYQGLTDLTIQLDAKKTEKIVNNLLSNAFKFTPVGGNIQINAQATKERFLLSIQDSGRGIHPKDLPYVFDRFFQSSQPNAAKEGGTGIGLSLAQEFAKLMQGKLWATSMLGKGSTFFFEIPIVYSTSAPIRDNANDIIHTEKMLLPLLPNEEKEVVPIPTNTPILLVEDNENLRTYIEIILGNRYNLTTAENGKVAWEMLNRQSAVGSRQFSVGSQQPDNQQLATSNQQPVTDNWQLIISDIMMPEMDGYQLLDKLKTDDRFRATPVIMLTALAELKDKLKALRIGVDDYMTKPFEEEELIARIDNLLRNSQLRQAFYQTQNGVINDNASQLTKPAKQPSIVLSQEDTEWLTDLEKTVKTEMGNFEFNVELLAQRCLMSRRKLERKLKGLTGLTPAQYIQEIRYAEARFLLETQTVKSIKAVVYQIGIKDSTNFSRTFKKRFGRVPSSYFG